MYFLAIQTQYGYDSVIQGTVKGVKPGDIVQDAKNIYLCLGNDISFSALYKKKQEYIFVTPIIEKRSLLTEKTIQIIHWIVREYFSSYKATSSLFLPRNEHFLTKDNSKKHIREKANIAQSCYIYPNLRTLYQQHPTIQPGEAILYGGLGIQQKQKLFFQIKTGQIQTLYATNRGLFFDWNNLQHIYLFDKDNWAYNSQSDPRFGICETAKYIATIYGAKLYL